MKILGVSALYHDSAASICIDGDIIAAAQEERFSRKKNDHSYPLKAIEYCLKEASVNHEELDAVVFYDNPLLKMDRWLKNCFFNGDNARTLIERNFDSTFSKGLWIHHHLRQAVGSLGKTDQLIVCNHHLSHASSAYYPSPFESAAVLTIDGVGEWASTTIFHAKEKEIIKLKSLNYPHSLGLLYSAFTYYCGFKINSGEYKMMGLAPYGTPTFCDHIKNTLIDIKGDGSFRLNLDYFSYHKENRMISDKFCDLFGNRERKEESPLTEHYVNIAASIQKVTEEIILKLARHAQEISGEKNLCLAGGVALNCVANGKIRSSGLYDRIWVQPAASDAGGALGAALYAYHNFFDRPRVIRPIDKKENVFLGPAFDRHNIEKHLKSVRAVVHSSIPDEQYFNRISSYLADGKVVGLFSDRMEFGPRALGSRSILGNPTLPDMQKNMNMKIKFRESFRPFAPAILDEYAAEYFQIDQESPYMLFTSQVMPEHKENLPAIIHVDGSARVQTVSKEMNPLLYKIISAFNDKTGCPLLINTSFNVRGEPIVCTPQEAYRCFMKTNMDILILGDFILRKEDQPITHQLNYEVELD